MNCTRIEDWLPAYVDGALPPRRARRVAAHLAGCAACREANERTAAALAAFDEAAFDEAAGSDRLLDLDLDGAFARVERRLDALERSPESPARPRWLDWRLLVPVGAGGALAAAGLALALLGPGDGAGGPPDGLDGGPGGLAGAADELAVVTDLDLLENLEMFALMDELGVEDAGDVDALAGVADLEDLEVVMAMDELLAEEGTHEG